MNKGPNSSKKAERLSFSTFYFLYNCYQFNMDSTEGQDDFRKLHRLLKLNHVGIVGDYF